MSSAWGITFNSRCFAEGMGECNPETSFGATSSSWNNSLSTIFEITVVPTELLEGASWQTKSLFVFLSEFLKYQKSKNIAFLTLEEINSSYLKKLREFLLNETNIKIDISTISFYI